MCFMLFIPDHRLVRFFMELLECDTMGEFRHRSIILECLSFSPSYSLSLLFRAVTARVLWRQITGLPIEIP